MIAYRPDIDGLRAVAVLAVIIFHLEPDWLRGGFAGVDIFFVISGFLITSILKKDLYNNQFSLAGFYERRARRILPALVTVCAVTLFVSYFFMFPLDYIELAKSEIATALSISNIFFWKIIDYFATASEEKPLLHTWSLGVEEQFYLFFPIILYFLDKFFPEKRTALVIAGLGIASLTFAQYTVHHFPSFAFYWLPSRFWEMALGAGLAYLPRKDLDTRQNNALACIGFIMIILSLALYSDDVKFPGLPALLPTLGAAFLIYASCGNIIAEKILKRNLMVRIGQMSYSLYLWHWPVFALIRYSFEDPNKIFFLAGLALTFALSYASWRYIETPFRNRRFLTRKSVFILSLMSLSALIAASFYIIHKDGIPSRIPQRALSIALTSNDHAPFIYETCLKEETQNDVCFFGDKDKSEISLVLWGDSHAASMRPLIDKIAKEKAMKGILLAKTSCPGFYGEYSWKSDEIDACRENNAAVFAFLKNNPEIKYVVFSGRWAPVAKEFKFENENNDAFYRALHHTADALRQIGKKPLYIAAVPEPGFNVPRCLSKKEVLGAPFFTCTPISLEKYRKEQAQTLAAFSALEEDNTVLYPHQALYKADGLLIQNGQDLLYFDDDHVSINGALYLYDDFKPAFNRFLQAGH